MDQHLIFVLLGLANGAVYAALALGLVVTYRSSGVLNFATGSMALFGGYMYAFLRRGELLLPLPFLPQTVSIGGDPGLLPSALIAIAISSLLGLGLYLLVFRPLRAAPPVAKAVASLGIMLLFTAMMTWRVGTSAVSVKPIFPTSTWVLGGVRITSDRVWFAVTILAITVVLAGVYRFTRFGMITRAAAETEKGAFVSGISPDRVAAINWMIGAAVAAVAGILIAPIVPLTPIGYTFFIVPALAAATMGRFVHIVPAVVGGLAIGMIQSEATYLQGQWSWLPQSGMAELVPLLLILLVLVLRGRPLPNRGTALEQMLGRAPRPRSLLVPTTVGALAGLAGLLLLQGTWRAALITSFILGIVALSLVVVTGYAGQVSLAQLTLAGVAGFILGPLTTSWNIPFPIAPILAALLAMLVGVVVGLPALRVRGLLVAVVTLALATTIEALWFRNPEYAGTSGVDVKGPGLFGLDLRSRVGTEYPRIQFGILVLVVLVGVALSVAKLRTSTLGSQMLAVRANERSASGAGIPVVRVKLLAFAIGAFIAGLGGSLLAYFQGNVTFDAFTTFLGLALFATVYVAGITSVSGGLLAGITAAGGIAVVAANEWIHLGDWYGILAGVAVVFTVIKNPEGLVGPIHTRIEERRRKRAPEMAPPTDPGTSRLVAMEPTPGGDVVLAAADVRVRFGGVVALDDVDLQARKGTIVGLIGPNGAGKTTLVDAITGFAPYTGKVTVEARDLAGLKPHQRAWASVGRTFQQLQLYDDLSVTENIVVGKAAAQGREPRDLSEVLDLLDLTALAEQPVGELSQGHRQLVSIARALIGNPDVLLLDEPAAGLDSSESQWLGQRLRSIRDSNMTILLIDHDMHLVLNLCDSIYVLNFGKVIAHGTPAEIRSDRAVADAYLGTTHADQAASS